jgi:hypothetical protein
MAVAGRHRPLGVLCARISRQLAYNFGVGTGMCKRKTNHFGASWFNAYHLQRWHPCQCVNNQLEHANVKGLGFWFGLSEGWHHLVMAKPLAYGQN